MRKGKRHVSFNDRQRRIGFFFVIPFVIGACFFVLIPFFQSLIFSFCKLTLTVDGFDTQFTGISNYYQIFMVDPSFRQQLVASVESMVINVPVAVLFSFFIASLLNQKFVGRSLARLILFVPVIISAGVITDLMSGDMMTTLVQSTDKTAQSAANSQGMATAFVQLMNEAGMDSRIVDFVVQMVNRLSDIISMSAVPIVIFLAGLQSISPSIFESAYIEGASSWEAFWKISFPMISPLILVTVVYSFIDSFTNISNPIIKTIHTTSFENMKFGVSAAMAISYMVIILALLAAVYKIVSKYVSYQT